MKSIRSTSAQSHPVEETHAPRRGRVLFVQYSSQPDGSTNSGLLTVRGLIEDGWKVHVAFDHTGPCISEYTDLGCTATIARHGQWLSGGSYLYRVRRWGREARFTAGFLRLLRHEQPKIVYINTLMGISAAAAATLQGIPTVWHIREQFTDVGGEMHPPAFGGKTLVRHVVKKCATRVVANSRAVAENVLGATCHPNLSIVPNAVADDFFTDHPVREECRCRLGLPCDGHIIGVPGMLRPVKGHTFALKAIAHLNEGWQRCALAITGEGPSDYRRELEKTIDELGIRDRVYFLGNVCDMRAFYGASDIVCVPSKAETFGRVIIEAFAAGVPVVASAVGGICEVVEDGVSGLLVRYADVESLVASFRRLLGDAGLRERVVRHAKARAVQEYTATVYKNRIRQIVRELTHSDL